MSTIDREDSPEPRQENEIKHTPGPWLWIDKPVIRDLFHGCSAIFSAQIEDAVIATIGEDVPGHEANAHLIAAAPELLESLKAMARLMEIAVKEIGGWSMAGYGGKTVGENIHHANAAIAKAEGRQ